MAATQKSPPPAASAKTAAAALQSGSGVSGTEVTAPAQIVPMAPLPGFKVKKVLTLPSLVLKEGAGAVLRFDSNPSVSKVVDKKQKREPATIAQVTDLHTGQQFTFLIPSVVLGNFAKDYYTGPKLGEDEKPDPTKIDVVGKVFAIQNMGKRTDSQRYNDFNIAELETAES